MNQFLLHTKKFYQDNKYKILSALIIIVIAIPGIIMPNLQQPQTQTNIGAINLPELPELKTPDLRITETVKNDIKFGNFGQGEEIPVAKPTKLPVPDYSQSQFNLDEFKVKKDMQSLSPILANTAKGTIYTENSDLKGFVSDKFPVDTSVKITYKGKSTIIKVDSKRVLSTTTLGIVSRQVFKDLGVDPLQVAELEVTVDQI